MKVPVEWLRSLVELPQGVTTEQLAARLTAVDLKLEEIISSGVSGPLVIGLVTDVQPEPQKNGKTINWCRVDVGPEHNDEDGGRGIVCGAHNFAAGDLVVVSLPGAVLPGGFAIAARKTYGHVSDGMICSSAELGLSDEADGIIVLPGGSANPGDDALALLGLDQETLDLEVNPDRAYALSLRGVGRDTAIAFGVDFVDPAERDVPSQGTDYPVEVHDSVACPYFVTRTVTGFDPTVATPAWMARRIAAAGMRSISLAVDVTNYVMLELGQPLHGYDRDKLQGAIGVRRAHEGERITTLDDVERELSTEDLLITDDRGPIGLAGLMGGADVELSDATTSIVIEAAHFDRVGIARSSRRHRLTSEASRRFERGVDAALPPQAAQRAAELLVELGGGQIEPGITAVGSPTAPVKVSIAADLPSRITGVRISGETAQLALEQNGCLVEANADIITATPPSWRFDLNDPYDLVEEVLRFVGYDQVPSVLPTAPGGRGLTRHQELRRRVGEVLAGAGLVEVVSFGFVGPEDFDKLQLPADDPRRNQVLLANPLSSQEPGMTTTLLPGLLRAANVNAGRGHEDFGVSQVARVFEGLTADAAAPILPVDRRPSPEQLDAINRALPRQPYHVGWVLVGQRDRATWAGSGRAATWADATSIAQRLARTLHVQLDITTGNDPVFHPGRCAALVLDGSVVGHAGELHPRVVEQYGLPARAVAAELDLDALIAAAPLVGPKPAFSTYPVAKEDYAFIVNAELPAAELARAIAEANDVIESVRLFDIYEGNQVGEGKKSLAFSLRLRGHGHTLGDEELRSARSDILKAAEGLGAELR